MADWDVNQLVPIREYVYRHLKNLILEGKFKTGDRLVERELAKKMQISRTPIREALFRLEAQGLVKTIPRKGVVVESISKEKIVEIFDILSVLEGLASKLAAKKTDSRMSEMCGQWIERIRQFLQDHQDDEIEKFHMDVCDFLYKAAKSPKLYLMLIDLTDYIRAFASVGYTKKGRMEEAMGEHIQILDAIRKGDAEKAQLLSERHIEQSKAVYLETAELEP